MDFTEPEYIESEKKLREFFEKIVVQQAQSLREMRTALIIAADALEWYKNGSNKAGEALEKVTKLL